MLISDAPALVSLLFTGFFLGWSVAWPPGPVNAEIVRRGLARGFWAAYGMALGGCTGDAVWALLVAFGASVMLMHDTARLVLWVVSTSLLFFLGLHYLIGAARAWYRHRRSDALVFERSARFDNAGAGFLLGMVLTLTSPWSIAFWLAVMGRAEVAAHGLAGALLLVLSVIIGAATWALILSGVVVMLRSRFNNPWWDVFTRAVTGLLLFYFAFRSLLA
jgi:threonine/homoserine/homoserine lactone efflux protein